jgi:hypothetical protein
LGAIARRYGLEESGRELPHSAFEEAALLI